MLSFLLELHPLPLRKAGASRKERMADAGLGTRLTRMPLVKEVVVVRGCKRRRDRRPAREIQEVLQLQLAILPDRPKLGS